MYSFSIHLAHFLIEKYRYKYGVRTEVRQKEMITDFCQYFSSYKIHLNSVLLTYCLSTIIIFLWFSIFAYSQEQATVRLQSRQYSIGWGLSLGISDVYSGDIGLIGSTMFEHRLNTMLAVQWTANLQKQSVFFMSRFQAPFIGGVFQSQTSRIAYGLDNNLDLCFTPTETLPNFRLGFGATLRWAGSINEYTTLATNLSEQISKTYTQQLALGVNTKVEYIVEIQQSLEICFFLQHQLYFIPFFTQGNRIPIGAFLNLNNMELYANGGSISLGAFLRINF